jgi:hypothetical protein
MNDSDLPKIIDDLPEDAWDAVKAASRVIMSVMEALTYL